MRNLYELNLSTIPTELELILELLKETDVEIFNNKFKNIEIDWDQFLQLAYHHRLFPILYKKLNHAKKHWIPSTVIHQLKSSYEKNTFHMLFLFGEIEALNQILQSNGIRALFLKGPILAKDLYDEISNRTCGDLDLLIPFKDLDVVDHILIGLGYEKDEYIKSLLGDWKWRHHHFTYFHPEKGTKVEIHWRLNPSPSKEPTFEDLWSNRRIFVLKDKPIHYLGEEDLFFFLVTHGARHGWSRLRWLMDIHMMLNKKLNWNKIKQNIRNFQSEKIVGQSLILSYSLLNTKIPNHLKSLTIKRQSKQLAQDAIFYLERMVNLHHEPVSLEISRFHARHLFSLMSRQQKFLHLLSILHPFYTDAEILPLPKQLHFLYFPLRPFLLLWKRKKQHALS
jgi:hypothetical protein